MWLFRISELSEKIISKTAPHLCFQNKCLLSPFYQKVFNWLFSTQLSYSLDIIQISVINFFCLKYLKSAALMAAFKISFWPNS